MTFRVGPEVVQGRPDLVEGGPLLVQGGPLLVHPRVSSTVILILYKHLTYTTKITKFFVLAHIVCLDSSVNLKFSDEAVCMYPTFFMPLIFIFGL